MRLSKHNPIFRIGKQYCLSCKDIIFVPRSSICKAFLVTYKMAARELLAPHHAEIRRRADIQAAGPDALNSKFFTRVEDDGIDQPFVNPEQIFVVFSLSQRELAPIPRDLTNPGVCFYGAFETRAEAMEHCHCPDRAPAPTIDGT